MLMSDVHTEQSTSAGGHRWVDSQPVVLGGMYQLQSHISRNLTSLFHFLSTIFYFPDLAIARYFASSDFLSLLFLSVFCSCESISFLVLFPAAAAVSLTNALISDRSKLLILTTQQMASSSGFLVNFSFCQSADRLIILHLHAYDVLDFGDGVAWAFRCRRGRRRRRGRRGYERSHLVLSDRFDVFGHPLKQRHGRILERRKIGSVV